MHHEKLRKLVTLVSGLDDETWKISRPLFKLKTLAKKEYFLKQGEICRYVGFVNQGFTRLFYDLIDGEVTKDFNTEGSFCGSYASFISGVPSHFNVIAMEPTELLIINRENLLQLTDSYMAWQKFLRIAMEQQFIRKENREALFLTATPEDRYTDLVKNHPDWINRIPLKYLASYLGLTAETVSRIRARK
jgi:CRP-like cAMP-binding protein